MVHPTPRTGGATETLECPYNKAHRILPHRMALHLAKCKKNHKGSPLQACPFNATHLVPEHEFQAHLETCSCNSIIHSNVAYRAMEEEKIKLGCAVEPGGKEAAEIEPRFSTGVSEEPEVPLEAEEWNAEVTNMTSYNPQLMVLTKPISRHPPSSLGKSARKEWRRLECARIKALQGGDPLDDEAFDKLGIPLNMRATINFAAVSKSPQAVTTSAAPEGHASSYEADPSLPAMEQQLAKLDLKDNPPSAWPALGAATASNYYVRTQSNSPDVGNNVSQTEDLKPRGSGVVGRGILRGWLVRANLPGTAGISD